MVNKDNACIGSVVKDSKPKATVHCWVETFVQFFVKLIKNFQELSAKLFTSYLYSC